jgi:hypothetical protein
VHEADPEAAEEQRAHPAGIDHREVGRDPGAHRIAHHVRVGDPEVVEQPAHVPGHDGGIVILRAVELLALAVAAVVEGDDAIAGPRERLDPERVDPVHRVIRREAVHEHDRIGRAGLRRHVDEGDAHAAR